MKQNVILIGGPYDGQTKEIKGKPAVFVIIESRVKHPSHLRSTNNSKYRLISENDLPLRYQFEAPDPFNAEENGPIYFRRLCDICDALVTNDNPATTTCSPTCTRARAAGRTREQQISYEAESYCPEHEAGKFCPICGLPPKECACRPRCH